MDFTTWETLELEEHLAAFRTEVEKRPNDLISYFLTSLITPMSRELDFRQAN